MAAGLIWISSAATVSGWSVTLESTNSAGTCSVVGCAFAVLRIFPWGVAGAAVEERVTDFSVTVLPDSLKQDEQRPSKSEFPKNLQLF